MKRFNAQLQKYGLLPIVCFKNKQELETFMNAIIITPIRCIEITLRNSFSPTAISYIKTNYPEFTVGAGTVITEEMLDCAISSGADFCVSPGYDGEIIEKAISKNITFLPGCSTPTEILQAVKKGFATLKFFPAECSGGVNALKLYQGAFSDVTFIPTGGITKENYLQYLNCKNVVACGGSFMIPKEKLASGNSEGIYNAIMEYLADVKEIKK